MKDGLQINTIEQFTYLVFNLHQDRFIIIFFQKQYFFILVRYFVRWRNAALKPLCMPYL